MKNTIGKIILIVGVLCLIPLPVNAKTIVEKRLAEVVKEYPDKSVMNNLVWVNGTEGGGCNALVMYTTLKVFHNAYVPGVNTFSQIGKTTSTRNVSNMKKLFKKAKIGDVIRWRNGYTDSHFAIYLSSNKSGVYLYECNFGKKNKVWYKHFWAWNNMKTWPSNGANKVNVYRSKNYNQVNKKKAALNYKKGDVFEVDGNQYKVIKAGVISGKVRYMRCVDSEYEGKVPRYIYVNKDVTKTINCNDDCGGGSSKKVGINAQYIYKVER